MKRLVNYLDLVVSLSLLPVGMKKWFSLTQKQRRIQLITRLQKPGPPSPRDFISVVHNGNKLRKAFAGNCDVPVSPN